MPMRSCRPSSISLDAPRGDRTLVVLHPLKGLSLVQAKKFRAINDRGFALRVAEFFSDAKTSSLIANGRSNDVIPGTPG